MTADRDKHEWQQDVDELLRRGRDSWPGLEDHGDALRVYLLEKLQAGAPPEELDAGELVLAFAICAGEEAALKVFETRYLSKARLAVRRLHLTEDAIDDVLARVREKLVLSRAPEPPSLLSYAGLGKLEGLVVVAATREAVSHLRKERADEDTLDEASSDLADSRDPRRSVLKTELSQAMRAAFEQAARSLTPRERNLLRLHFVDHLSIDEIGELHRVHRATAARWLARAKERLSARSRQEVMSSLELPESELGRVLDLVESQLSLSLSRVLRSTSGLREG